jgi:FkbM family methyltransferase
MIERSAQEMKAALAARQALVEGTGQRSLAIVARNAVARALHLTARLTGRPIRLQTRTFWNGSMALAFPEIVSECIFKARYYEPGLTTMVIDHLPPGGVFIDVGAHFGYFSLLASALVGPGGQVHAFEPTPTTYAVLSANVRQCPNITPVNNAVYDVPTTLNLNDYGVQYSAYNSLFRPRLREDQQRRAIGTSFAIEATTLDRYLSERNLVPQFVKIDAESVEMEVLKGAERMLAERRTAVSIEVGDDTSVGEDRRSRDIIDHLLARGYRALEFKQGALVPHQPKERYEYDNLLFLPEG